MRRKNGCLITIGSFDGVHRGHQALLSLTAREAKKRKLTSVALTFKVPPRMVLNRTTPLSILSDPIEKEFLIRQFGIEQVKTLTFDKKFSTTKPFHFLRDELIGRMKARGLVIGSDFRFGLDRSAGAIEMVRWGIEFGIPVWVVAPIKWRRQVISSSLIRTLLENNRYDQTVGFLGHPYIVQGIVVRGRGLGSKWGFPTANLKISEGKILPKGVFAVKATVQGQNKKYHGVCNIGYRPTLGKMNTLTVEVHLFGRPGSLRGQQIMVSLIHYLRGEKKFKNMEMLARTVRKDIANAKKVLVRSK